jgi:hypothetical protein
MKDKFNGNSEKRSHPPNFRGHEVYEIVKDLHVILVSRKGLTRKLKKMTCRRSNRFFGSYRIGKT